MGFPPPTIGCRRRTRAYRWTLCAAAAWPSPGPSATAWPCSQTPLAWWAWRGRRTRWSRGRAAAPLGTGDRPAGPGPRPFGKPGAWRSTRPRCPGRCTPGTCTGPAHRPWPSGWSASSRRAWRTGRTTVVASGRRATTWPTAVSSRLRNTATRPAGTARRSRPCYPRRSRWQAAGSGLRFARKHRPKKKKKKNGRSEEHKGHTTPPAKTHANTERTGQKDGDRK